MTALQGSTICQPRHCKVCGTGVGKGKHYCKVCGTRTCGPPRKERLPNQACLYCGTIFRIDKNKPGLVPNYCSSVCGNRSYLATRRAIYARNNESRKQHTIRCCAICKREFNPHDTVIDGNKSYKACSVGCKKELTRNMDIARGALKGVGRRGQQKNCVQCGVTFTDCGWSGLYCSSTCKRKKESNDPVVCSRNKMRRAKFYGKKSGFEHLSSLEYVDILKVYERDKWKCKLCGKKVDKEAKYPDRMSASIDHIMPLSCGGNHSSNNLQLAHLACNLAKGNRSLKHEQLLLFG